MEDNHFPMCNFCKKDVLATNTRNLQIYKLGLLQLCGHGLTNWQVRVRLTEFSGSGSLTLQLSTFNLLTHTCLSFVFRLISLCWQLTSLREIEKSWESLFSPEATSK